MVEKRTCTMKALIVACMRSSCCRDSAQVPRRWQYLSIRDMRNRLGAQLAPETQGGGGWTDRESVITLRGVCPWLGTTQLMSDNDGRLPGGAVRAVSAAATAGPAVRTAPPCTPSFCASILHAEITSNPLRQHEFGSCDCHTDSDELRPGRYLLLVGW